MRTSKIPQLRESCITDQYVEEMLQKSDTEIFFT